MSTLALGGAGAGVGYYFGGPMGAQMGFALGTMLGGTLFPDVVKQSGPRISDLRVTESAYGAMLPIVYGTIPVPGNVIDASDLHESAHTKKTGGGKGGGGPVVKQTTYTYSVDLAIALCEGEIAGLLQLYANEILIYDATPGTTIGKPDWLNIKIYPGSETQAPDPTLEAIHGAGNVPGYRGAAYLVLRRFELEQFGNRLPNFRAVVAVAGSLSNSSAEMADSVISAVGQMMRHPNTGAIFVTGNGVSGLNGRAYNPFTKTPLFALAQETGGAVDNSSEMGFFSVPVIVDGEQLSLGPNRHVFYGDSLGHGITIHDAYTGAFVGSVYLDGCSGADNEPAVVIDERAGKIVRACSSGVSGLKTFSIVNSGILFDGSTALDTVVPIPSFATGPADWGWKPLSMYPNGTDRRGIIAIIATHVTGADDYFVAVENSRIKSKTTDGLSAFETPSLCKIVYDSVRALFWCIGIKAGDASKTIYKAYDENASVIETHEVTQSATHVTGYDYNALTSSIYSFRLGNGELYRFDTGTGEFTTWTGFPTAAGSNWNGLAWHNPSDTAWVPFNVSGKLVTMTPDRLSTATTTLDDIVSDLLDRADIASADYDVTGLSSVVVKGYRIGRRTTARAAIEPLRVGFLWDLIDNGADLKAVRRGQTSSLTLASADLGAQEDSDGVAPMITVNRVQSIELPRELTISYLDPGAYYEQGTQRAIRLASTTDESKDIALPLVLDEDEAAQLCEILLHAFQIEREQYKGMTHLGRIEIEGADVVTLEDDANSYNARILSIEIAGPIIAVDAVREYDVYSSAVSGVPTIGHAPTVTFGGPTLLFILEIPMLRDADNDPGFYVAAGSYTDGWPGCGLYKSSDLITYQFAEGVGVQAAFGFVQEAGATGPMYLWDESLELTVAMTSGALESVTQDLCFAEANAAAWGQPGRWELVLFRAVVDNADGTYTVTGFVRGMRGTEHNRATHQAGDVFIVLDAAALKRVGIEAAEIGATSYYKGITYGDTVDASTSAEIPHTHAATALKPWAPVHIEVTGFGGDITIAWQRQDRIKAAPFQQPAMSEDSESYEIDIMSGSTVKRTLASATKTVTYTSAQQTTDFGGPVSTLEVNVYQLSAVVGRGYAGN